MQCDVRCSTYSPCVSTCATETCDNLLTHSKLSMSCKEDTCVEGCSPKPCPPNHIYLNSSFLDCVPTNTCKPVCLEIDGVVYLEGDLVSEDECQSCYCSRGQKTCSGQPCATTAIPDDVTHQHEQKIKCNSGWSSWINQDKAVNVKSKSLYKEKDEEPLPEQIILNNLKESSTCPIDKMIDIECRTVKSHIPYKKTGLNVECSLEKGLICESSSKGSLCPDFEIRVLCECGKKYGFFNFSFLKLWFSIDTPLTTPEPSCDASQPHQEHPNDCHLFYHCVPGTNGNKLVQKSCGASMMYNPVTMICDWPSSVIQIKADCASSPCPPGHSYDPCVIQCDKVCLHYAFVLQERGDCKDGASCAGGCVSEEKKTKCPLGMYRADETSCVSINDCMCRSKNGTLVKVLPFFLNKI